VRYKPKLIFRPHGLFVKQTSLPLFYYTRFQLSRRAQRRVRRRTKLILRWKTNPYFMIKRRKYMSRRRLAIRKHSTYKPDLKKIAAHRRASRKRLQRKKKRKKREAKAKRAKGFNKKGRNQKKKKKSSPTLVQFAFFFL